MKMYSRINLGNFEFWSGAKDLANQLSYEQLNRIGNEIN